MNVLVYNDLGASPNSVKHTINTLKGILGHAYDIIQVDAKVLQTEPWETGCAMLVMPGGRDMPYCQALNGEPNTRIKAFVEKGGNYLGLCAGAYYGSKEIEFEKGRVLMEIIQPRELGFYPGLSRGTTYPGFVYNSESGARSVAVTLDKRFFDPNSLSCEIKMYYNGGGYFVHPEKYDNVTVLGRYKDPSLLCKDETEGPAAVVDCKVGNGHAILIGTHPEYDFSIQDLVLRGDNISSTVNMIVEDLILSERDRKSFLRAIFGRIGLNVTDNAMKKENVPEVTPLYLIGITKEWNQKMISQLLRSTDPVTHLLEDNYDIFHISASDEPPNEQAHLLNLYRQKENKPPLVKIVYQRTSEVIKSKFPPKQTSIVMDTTYDPSLINRISESGYHGVNDVIYPPKALTPHFNMEDYFKRLLYRRSEEWGKGEWLMFGNGILYAETIGSTQSILYNNFKFSQALPTGSVMLATNQVAGKGRGRNSWVSHSGALQFSMIIRHGSILLEHAPVVFIQYIFALAVVNSIRDRPGYLDIPLRLKWPNDIYTETKDGGIKKVGGILINSTFVDNEYVLVIGCGINLSNTDPTVSINDIIQEYNPSAGRLSPEDVLAGILVKFELYYSKFCEHGMGSWFLMKYYQRWLHSGSVVKLTTHNNEAVRIVGITSDYGMLKVESLDKPGKSYGLLPDGNSFDMMNGLLVQKK